MLRWRDALMPYEVRATRVKFELNEDVQFEHLLNKDEAWVARGEQAAYIAKDDALDAHLGSRFAGRYDLHRTCLTSTMAAMEWNVRDDGGSLQPFRAVWDLGF